MVAPPASRCCRPPRRTACLAPVAAGPAGRHPGSGSAPGIAILAEVGKPPHFVQEGPYNDDIIVGAVMPDHVVLRRRATACRSPCPDGAARRHAPAWTAARGRPRPRPPENGAQSVEKSDKT